MSSAPISADSHIVEPREIFDAAYERFGDRAPHVIQHPDWGDFVVSPGVVGRESMANIPGVAVGRLGIAGMRLNNPETQQLMRRGYAGLRPGIVDPNERLKDQDLDGVAAEVMYPSLFFRVFGLPDAEVIVSLF